MNRDLVLEVLNGIWAVLDYALLTWFTYYIWAQVKELDQFFLSKTLSYWWRNGLPAHINAAIAIYVFTTGDVIVRSYIWYWRHFANLGRDEHWLPLYPIIIGGTIAAVGLLCKIRVFTIYRLGNIAWVLSLLLAISIIVVAWLTAGDYVSVVHDCSY